MSNFRHAQYPTPDVPAGPRVADDYFSNAVLVGDSTAESFRVHNVIPEIELLTVMGLSPRTAATNAIFEHGHAVYALPQKLAAMEPSIIYLWLGSNGVDAKPAEQVLEDYDELLNLLLAETPDALVYLLELAPVKPFVVEKYPGYSNERVDTFNAGLREVARRHNVYLLPVNVLLRNEEGILDDEFGAGDGIHLRRTAYATLAEFIYTHTIPLEVD